VRRPRLRRPARSAYGRNYQIERLPAFDTSDDLQRYTERMSWYHSIDLGGGVITRGIKDIAVIDREWGLFALGDLTGQSLLDIGGADGAYAFRAERAGAAPAAVLDHYVWAAEPDQYGRIYHQHVDAGLTPPAPHDTEAWQPDALPGRWRFDTARQALRSSVQAITLDFMDCDLDDIGTWDVVLYLGVLYHMENPIGALRRLASVTRRQAIIETLALYLPAHPEPMWSFFPSGELNHDRTTWWSPNLGALLGALGAAGFANAEVLAGEPHPAEAATSKGPRHYRAIVRAVK
jgi:tRNA (mo5U34)-methyltransferase